MVSSMYISLFEVLAVFCLFPWSKRSWSGTVVSSSLCRLAQFSRMCCCVSSARPHPLHVCVGSDLLFPRLLPKNLTRSQLRSQRVGHEQEGTPRHLGVISIYAPCSAVLVNIHF